MLTPQEELGRLSQERLAREAQAARIARTVGANRTGFAHRVIHRAGESFISLGIWMKQVSHGEPAGDQFEIQLSL